MATDSGKPTILPFTFAPEQRGTDSSLDSKIVDGYLEPDKEGNIWANKRPSIVGAAGSAVGAGYGITRWNGVIYEVIGNSMYKGGAFLGTVVGAAPGWWNTTKGTPSYLYYSNGANGYTVDSAGTFAHITDANYPAGTVPGSAYLDGTFYVMDTKANVWGSLTLNNPNTWSATNVIVAQIEPDGGVALAKQAIYVIALKQWTTEVFYDAGVATGSPLLPVQNAKQPYGCVDGRSVASADDILYWVSANRTGGIRVVQMQNLACKVISTPPIDRYLENVFAGTSPVSFMVGWVVRLNGHTFYGVSFYAGHTGSPGYLQFGPSVVYDITADNWYFWGGANGFPIIGAAGSEGQFFKNATVFQRWDTAAQFSFVDGVFAGDTYDNSATFSPVVTDIITPNFDGGTNLGKVLTRMKMQADENAAGVLQVRYSDNDYKSWSQWINVPLTDGFPTIPNLGTFRPRRAFQFRHASPTSFRMKAAELELLLCPV